MSSKHFIVNNITMKNCGNNKCPNRLQPLGNFGKETRTKDGLKSYCKDCIRNSTDKEKRSKYDKNRYEEKREKILERKAEYYQENREEIKKEKKKYRENNPHMAIEYRKNNPEKVAKADRKNSLRRKYGLTEKQYEEMLEGQDGCCWICKSDSPNSKGKKNLFVDHDHVTGKVRGLLCQLCNMSLGGFKDDIKLLQKAIEYLKKTK